MRSWRKVFAGVVAVLAGGAVALSLLGGGSSGGGDRDVAASSSAGTRSPASATTRKASPRAVSPERAGRRAGLAVAALTEHFYDASRGRKLTTVVRYPRLASGVASASTRRGPPYPLIVFGHGFAVTPSPYAPLLDAWVRAGYVVAAPIFPLGNQNAPGGPDEHDLPNQAADMNFVIRRMLQRSTDAQDALAGLVTAPVAVAGQSDGGDTALASAFDPADHRLTIGAAAILSGAEDPFAPRFTPQAGTPLLAVQGTADEVNLPSETTSYFSAASRPRFLLLLEGAGHQEPYTVPGPTLDAVARVTTAFFDRYLRGEGRALRRLTQRRAAGPEARLEAFE